MLNLLIRLVTALAAAGATASAAPPAPSAPLPPSELRPAAAVSTRITGADISWPQCPKWMGIPTRKGQGAPMPRRGAKFVVVGVTNGPGFYPNPCLGRQMRWVRSHHVYAAAYAMTTYPRARRVRTYGARGPHSHATLFGRLWNTGYAEARFNVATMKRVGLASPIVWVDVEPYPVAPWSSSKAHNAAVVQGAVKAYQNAGYRVGFYSTTLLWHEVVGDLRYGQPEWRTAGQTSLSSALRMCSRSTIQGGHAVMAQWWGPRRDFDVICPRVATAASLRTYFHKY